MISLPPPAPDITSPPPSLNPPPPPLPATITPTPPSWHAPMAIPDPAQEEKKQQAYRATREQVLDNIYHIDDYVKDKDLTFARTPGEAKTLITNDLLLRLYNQGQPAPHSGLERHILMDRAITGLMTPEDLSGLDFRAPGADREQIFATATRNLATRHKNQLDLSQNLYSAAILHATLGQANDPTAYSTWKEKARTLPGYDPDREADYLEAWTQAADSRAEALEPFRKQLDEVWSGFQKGDTNFYFIHDQLEPENREAFKQAVGYLAKSLPKNEQAAFFTNLSKQTGRDFENLGIGMLEALFNAPEEFIQAGLAADTSEKRQQADLEERRSKDFIREIRDIAEGTYDPVKPAVDWLNDHVERGIYAAPGAAFSTASALVPYAGQVAVFGLAREDAYQKIRRNLLENGASADQASEDAASLATIAAVPSALLDRLGAKAVVGQLPALNRLMTSMADRFGGKALTRVGTRIFGGAAYETGTERIQDLLPPLVQEISSSLSNDIPGVQWNGKGGELDGFWGQTVETFIATLPLAIFGAARGHFQDQSLQAFNAAPDLQLKAYGMTDEAITGIRRSRGHASLDQAVEYALQTRTPHSEEAQAATHEFTLRLRTQQQAMERANTSSSFPDIIQTNGRYAVLDGTTKQEIGTSPNIDGALRLATTHSTAFDTRQQEKIEFMTSLLESGQEALAINPQGEIRHELGTLMSEELIAAQDPANIDRFRQQAIDREQMHGGTSHTTLTALGSSRTEFRNGVRHYTNRLFSGAHVTTVFHELFHTLWARQKTSGSISREDAISLIRSVDQVMTSKRQRARATGLRLLQEGIADHEITDRHIDEALAEIAEMEILRTRRLGRDEKPLRVTPGIISRNMTALVKLSPGSAAKFSTFLHAIRGYFGLSLARAIALKKAARDGTFDTTSYEAFLSKISGTPGDPTPATDSRINLGIHNGTAFSLSRAEALDIRKKIEAQDLIELSTSEIPSRIKAKEAIIWALENGAAGETHHPGIGKIEIRNRGIKNAIGHLLNPRKAVALLKMKELIPTATIMHFNQREGASDSYRLARRLAIDGKEYIARIVIDTDANGNRFYNHELSDLKQLQDETKSPQTLIPGANPEDQQIGVEELEDTGKLLRWIYSVNENDIKYTDQSNIPPPENPRSSEVDTKINLGIHNGTAFSLSRAEALDIRKEIEKQIPLETTTRSLPDLRKVAQVKQWAIETGIYGETFHPQINGSIRIAPSSIKSEIAHHLSAKKAASLAKMKDLIPVSTYIESNRRKQDVMSHRLAGVITIDNQAYVARIVVDEDLNGNRLYNHELSDLKSLQEIKSPQPLQSGAAQGQRIGWQEFEDTAKLLQWIYSVNENDADSATRKNIQLIENPQDLATETDGTAFSLAPVPSFIRSLDNTNLTNDTTTHERQRDPAHILQSLRDSATTTPTEGDGGTGLRTDGGKRRKYGRQLASHATLMAWARENGKILNSHYIDAVGDADHPGGGEHKILFDDVTKRVVKLTKPGLFGAQGEDAGAYLERWALHNKAFGDDVTFEGLVTLPGEQYPRAVISQAFAEGRDATEEEQRDYLIGKGFHEMPDGKWIHPIRAIQAWDTITPGNAILTEKGVRIVDLQMAPADPRELAALRQKTGIGRDTSFSIAPLGKGPRPIDPRIREIFGEFTADEYGLPPIPKTLPDDHPLLQETHGKATAHLPEDHILVITGQLPAGEISRKKLADAIIRHFLKKARPLNPGEQPIAYVSGGGGGAGKSTILKKFAERGILDTAGAVSINADDIKELLPEFKQIKDKGDGRAAYIVHTESIAIADRILAQMVKSKASERYHFVYDSTLSHPESTHDFFRRWKKAGYQIHLIGVVVDPLEGMIRASTRARKTGRWVPNAILAKAHESFLTHLPEYVNLVDAANVVDNSGENFIDVLKKSGSHQQLIIENPSLWNKLTQK